MTPKQLTPFSKHKKLYTANKLPVYLAIWLVISTTPAAGYLEANIQSHMIIQLPLLGVIGFLIGGVIITQFGTLTDNKYAGYASVLIALFTTLYWMIPRSLDLALTSAFFAWAKYISIPVLIGMPLAFGWYKVGVIFKGFMIIEFLAMLFRLGWLYKDSPVRLCSSYGLYEQNLLGNYLIVIAFLLSLYWAAKIFFQPN